MHLPSTDVATLRLNPVFRPWVVEAWVVPEKLEQGDDIPSSRFAIIELSDSFVHELVSRAGELRLSTMQYSKARARAQARTVSPGVALGPVSVTMHIDSGPGALVTFEGDRKPIDGTWEVLLERPLSTLRFISRYGSRETAGIPLGRLSQSVRPSADTRVQVVAGEKRLPHLGDALAEALHRANSYNYQLGAAQRELARQALLRCMELTTSDDDQTSHESQHHE